MRADNWLRMINNQDTSAHLLERTKQKMRAAFFMRNPVWEHAVLERFKWTIKSLVHSLSNSSLSNMWSTTIISLQSELQGQYFIMGSLFGHDSYQNLSLCSSLSRTEVKLDQFLSFIQNSQNKLNPTQRKIFVEQLEPQAQTLSLLVTT